LVRSIAQDAVHPVELLGWNVVDGHPESEHHELEECEGQEQGRKRYQQEIPNHSHPQLRLSERSRAGQPPAAGL
jgi:hypothetical protein